MTQVGEISLVARIDTKAMQADAAKMQSIAKTGGNKASSAIAAIGKSSVVAAAGVAALAAAFSPFIRDAVKRVDTLNAFPRVMSNMGISGDDARKAIFKLDKGIRGLPTALDTGTLAIQRLTSKTNDVDKATDIFLAFNNAVIAGAAPLELQTTATEQFAQSFAKGKPDMIEWRSMLAAMPAQLGQVAKSMGLASADKLGESLRNGKISMEDFGKELVKLNSQGVGGLPSLAQQAKNATDGLQTGFANAKTAVTRGIADILTAIGTANIAGFITKIGASLEKVFNFIADNIGAVSVFIGTILAGAFAVLAVKVAAATWPILLIAAGVTALYLAFQKFRPQIQSVIDKFKEFWGTIKPIRDYIANEFRLAFADMKKAWEDVRKALEPYMPQIKEAFKWTAIIAAVFVGVLVAALVVTVLAIARLIGWLMKIGAAIESFKAKFMAGLGALKEIVMNALNGAGEWLYNAGKAIIDGLVRGITSKIDAVKGVLNAITSKLPDWKGPMQVDRRILQESGAAVMQGFTRGLVSEFSNVRSTLGSFTNSMGGGYSPQSMGVSSIAGSGQVSGGGATYNINIGTITKEADADAVIRKLTRMQELESRGITT